MRGATLGFSAEGMVELDLEGLKSDAKGISEKGNQAFKFERHAGARCVWEKAWMEFGYCFRA